MLSDENSSMKDDLFIEKSVSIRHSIIDGVCVQYAEFMRTGESPYV